MKNEFLPLKEENLDTGILLADTKSFGDRKILDIGGTYRNRYAIVEN